MAATRTIRSTVGQPMSLRSARFQLSEAVGATATTAPTYGMMSTRSLPLVAVAVSVSPKTPARSKL